VSRRPAARGSISNGIAALGKNGASPSPSGANIQDLLNEYRVQIMSPHYMTDPAQPQIVPKSGSYAAPAKLVGGENRRDR
jgi:hypothetical protein